MRQVDVLVIGNGPRAVAVADHAFSLSLSTLIVSPEALKGFDSPTMHEEFEHASLTFDIRRRILQITTTTSTTEVKVITIIIAMEPAVTSKSFEEFTTEDLVDSFATTANIKGSREGTLVNDLCLNISLIRNAHVFIEPHSILCDSDSSFLRYLNSAANLTFLNSKATQLSLNKVANNFKYERILIPANPLASIRLKVTSRDGKSIELHVKKPANKRIQSFYLTNISRVFVLREDYPTIQQADDILRWQIFPGRLFQRKTTHPRMCVEYSHGHRLLFYGSQRKALEKIYSMYITIRLPSISGSVFASEIYLTQLGAVLGFVLFLPELDSLVAPLTLCCDQKISIVNLLPSCNSQSHNVSFLQDPLVDIILKYYDIISSDKAVCKALSISFRYRQMIAILLYLSPVLLFLVFLVCALLIF